MGTIHLTGRLVCRTDEEADLVARYLPTHLSLTRAEPGCLAFTVTRIDGSLSWDVNEQFVDAEAFNAHQARVAESEWGRVTSSLLREYVVTGMPDL